MYRSLILLISILGLLVSCSTTKNIPENKYLLNSIKVKHATRNATSDLEDFVRQQPNNKLRLMVYNAAGSDTTKWMTRFVRKMGQAPIIYSPSETKKSANQLQKELVNQGYLNAAVDTLLQLKGAKMDVTYDIKAREPYRVRNYSYEIQDSTMSRIMHKAVDRYYKVAEISPGDFYDMSLLEAERDRVNSVMRNVGYADFSKEYVYFRADTTLNSHEVDLFLDIYMPKGGKFNRYRIDSVTVISGLNEWQTSEDTSRRRGGNRSSTSLDTTDYRGITIVRGRNHFLRNSSIRRNNYLRKGYYYSDQLLTMTYESFSKMGAVKQVNITTTPSHKDSLRLMDAKIILTPGNAHWFSASLDGTNSAGDIGVAPSVSYQYQNLFNGSEVLAIKLKGAYEFIANSDDSDVFNENFYEYGADISVTFPTFVFPWLKKSWKERPSASTQFSVGLTNQRRPEYSRQFFNFTAKYNWSTKRNAFRHTLDVLDVNYVRMPWVSDTFRKDFLEDGSNPLLKESYKDQLITRTGYSGSLTRGRRFNLQTASTTLRFGAEVSGLLPRLASVLGGTSKSSEDGSKQIMGVSYAEYVKGDIDFAQTYHFSKRHTIAYHVGMGIAQPYGNSNILPFERRFFAGGSNSIRGWNTRSLGPGSFKPVKGKKNFVNQAGDFILEMSVEDRHKLTDLFEVAGFIDAGNIWTLKDYEPQKGGQFAFDSFYKEIALAYGVGLRLDLGFLLLRLDVGVRLYDPGRDEGDRWVAPALPRTALHFGIGYPF